MKYEYEIKITNNIERIEKYLAGMVTENLTYTTIRCKCGLNSVRSRKIENHTMNTVLYEVGYKSKEDNFTPYNIKIRKEFFDISDNEDLYNKSVEFIKSSKSAVFEYISKVKRYSIDDKIYIDLIEISSDEGSCLYCEIETQDIKYLDDMMEIAKSFGTSTEPVKIMNSSIKSFIKK